MSAEARLLAVGDVMLGDSSHFLGRGVGSCGRRLGLGHPFARVAGLLAGGDVFFANLESPLAADPGRGPWGRVYRAPLAAAEVLRLAPLNVVSTASNHMLQHGPEVVRQTGAALAAAGVHGVGFAAQGSLADAAARVNCAGLELAFHAACLARGPGWPVPDRDRLARELVARLEADPACAKIVSLHWGDEYSPQPAPWQRALARRLVAAGAMLVLGHHPHVLQPIEAVGSALVAYSLGNFVFDQRWTEDTRCAGILDVRLGLGGVLGWAFHPTRLDRDCQAVPATGAVAAAIRERIAPPRELAEPEYARLAGRALGRHRRRMKTELLQHLPQVSSATWTLLLARRLRRARPAGGSGD